MQQQSRSKTVTNTTNHQPVVPVDSTTKIKPVHALGLLARNPGPIEKNNSKEVLPQPLRQKKVAMMRTFPIMAPSSSTGQHSSGDTVMSSMASSYSSVLSTPSVAGSVEFTETHPEALRGLDIDKDRPTNFFHDAKNIGFTSADGEPWYLVHNYNETELKLYRNYSRWNLSKVLQGRNGEEIVKLMKYITWSGNAKELFDKGGPRLTPVMTITGLQKMLNGMKRYLNANVFDIAEKNILLFIHGNAAPSAPIQETCSQVSNVTGQEAPADDQEVPGDMAMNDTESESEVDEFSTGSALACLLYTSPSPRD